MSVVTNVMLHVGCSEEVTLEQINTAANVMQGQALKDITDGEAWGGHKYPEVTLYAAAYNHLLVDTFMESLAGVPWTEPDEVQLFICRQDDYGFTVYQLVDKEWVPLVPAVRAAHGG